MAIHPSGCCDYTVTLHRRESGFFSGRAAPTTHGRHPGLCGEQPDISVESGTLVMRLSAQSSAQFEKAYQLAHTPRWLPGPLKRLWPGNVVQSGQHEIDRFPPATEVRIDVGALIDAVIAEGDVLNIFREATGDWGLTLFRGNDLWLAVGAISSVRLRRQGSIEADPRTYEERLYHLKRTLEEPPIKFVWVDASDLERPRTLKEPSGAGPYRMVYAIAGAVREQRMRANHRLSGFIPPGYGGCEYVDVDSRFADPEQWLAYVRALPDARPSDVWIRLQVGDSVATLREGEYQHVAPWHMYVERLYRDGMPGQLAQLAIVRDQDGITGNAVIDTTRLIAGG